MASNNASLDGSGLAPLLPDPRTHPMITVEWAAAVMGISRSKAYAEARAYLLTSGQAGVPAVRFGRSVRVPTRRLLEYLGLEGTDG